MPWNKDGGGGGWQGAAAITAVPGARARAGPEAVESPNSPDLDELIRRLQAGLRNIWPTGGGRAAWIVPIILVISSSFSGASTRFRRTSAAWS